MKKFIFLFVVIFLLINISIWADTTVSLLDNEVIVKGKNVYLKDIANIEGDLKDTISAVRIITSPSPGNIRKIEKTYVILRLKQAGFTQNIHIFGPDMVTVKRAYQEISRDLIKSLIEEKIKDIVPTWAKRFEIFINIPNFSNIAPLGDLDIFIEIPPADKIRSNSISIPVTISIDGDKWKKIYTTCKVLLYADVPLAIRSIKKGEKITEDAYRKEERKITKLNFPYIAPEEVKGYEAVRNIYPGNIIDLSFISRPQLVKRGEIVNVLLIRGAIMIRIKAMALQGGAKGDLIQLKNIKSGKKFTGIVDDYGLVIVR